MNKSGSEEQDESSENRASSRLAKSNKRGRLLFVGVVVLLLIALAFAMFPDDRSTRSESYKDVSGAAGLNATIIHDGKPVSDFNVYILKEDGRQYGVFRPDKDGRVQLAAPEGDYVMLIGKQFGGEVFPQEPLALKNGKALELELKF